MRTILTRAAAIFAAAVALAATPTQSAQAQKALVYCPVGIDETGCTAIVNAISTRYLGGVDKGWDGTNGTVDLATVDVGLYSVFVVPSLADDSTESPYAKLRTAAIAQRLDNFLTGRIVLWSGTPDQGSASRTEKDALLMNFVAWADANYATVRGPGLVVLQDQSENSASRYGWVAGLVGINVVADAATSSYAGVRTLDAVGGTLMSYAGGQFAFTNMASYGFYLPAGAAGISLSAVGQTGTSTGGQVVLITSPGGNTGTAVVTTDRDDYAPGDTVTMTGTGWAAGETITITLHEDPLTHGDRTLAATADASGKWVNKDFVPELHDIGVRFVLTALSGAGTRAQTTFTDAPRISTVSVGAQVGALNFGTAGSATYTVTPVRGNNGTVNGTLSVTLGLPTGVTVAFSPNSGTWTATGGTVFPSFTLTLTTTSLTPQGTFTFTVRAADGGDIATNTGTLVVGAPACTAPSITLQPVAQTVTYPSNATFTATASGSPAPTVQWQVKIGAGAFTDIAGATSTTLTLTAPPASASTNQYQAVFTNSCGSATSSAATLTVNKITVTPTVTVANKVYDGNTTATILTRTLTGVLAADAANVTLTGGTATFDTKSVGTGKTVSIAGLSLSGSAIANYQLSSTSATTTADITALGINGSVTAANKIYDGNTTATMLTRTLTGVLSGDVVSYIGGTATFADKNVGNGKTVTATGLSLTGADAGNYTVNTTAVTTANITPKALVVAATGINKAYDGTAAATVTLSDDRVVGDVFTTTYTVATFADKNVGAGKTVGVSGISISGTDASNYTFNTTATTTANITAIALTGVVTVNSKTYDGTTAATIATRSVTGAISGDAVSLTGGTATFDTKHVGTGKTVTISALSLSGTDAGNYTLASSSVTATANITALGVTGSVTVANKVYDGTTSATISLRTLTGAIGGDAVSLSGGTATFTDKNVGNGKTVNVTGLSLAGADAGNYSLGSTSATATADITPLAITGSITAASKVYNGDNVAAILTRTLAGQILLDVVSYTGGSATFDNKNVGTGKTVTATGLALTGADAGNYTVNGTATTTANITALAITGSITASSKVYDGTTLATIVTRTLTGAIGGDNVSYSGGTATFDTKNVGTGKTVTATGLGLSGTDAGNYTVNSSAATTADITALAIVGSITAANRVYDATAAATILTRTLAGQVLTDDVQYVGGTATFADKIVGNGKTVTGTGLSLAGADVGNYTVNSTATTTANITALAITGSITASDKVYDGTTAAAIASRTLTGVLAGDAVSYVGGTATFANKIIGNAKTVTGTGLSLGGADVGNYTVNSTATTTADITPRPLLITAAGIDRIYDATANATVTLSDDRVSGDLLTTSYGAASFNNKNVGVGKPVSVTGITLTGADAGNYTFNTTSNTSANITALAITGSITASDKVYDGTTSAAIASRTLTGVISGDAVSYVGGTATFANKNIGNAKTVMGTGLSLSGADAGNYTVNATATTTASISALAITGSITANSKVYDGNTSAVIATRTLAGDISGDDVSYSGGTATFDTKDVGTGKTVTATGLGLSGTDAGNYTVNSSAATTADITALAITGSVTASSKVYDGNNTGTIASRTLAGVISPDVVTYIGGSATFADKDAGAGKTVTATGLSLAGTNAGNYTVNSTATTTANITPRALTVSATGINKVYDGTTAAFVTLSDNRVAGDVLTITYASASFGDENVGVGKTVSVSGINVTGTDAGNYTFNSTTTTTATITARPLAVTATGIGKVYDATTVASVTLADNRVAGDVLVIAYSSASFADKNVAVGKIVTVYGISISGLDAGNYSANTTTTTTADITVFGITGSITANNKVYDGTAAATFASLTLTGVLGVDAVSYVGGTATFADKNVANGKPVTGTGLSLSGSDAGNYTVNTTAATTANITTRALTVAATGISKVFDNTTAATVTLSDNRVSGDVFITSYATASFADLNVGAGKLVSVTGISIVGADAGNYTFNTTTTTTANITSASTSTSVTVTPVTAQYSDRVSFEATITPGIVGGANAATAVTFSIGSQVMGSAPLLTDGANLKATLSNVALLETVASAMSPGSKTVTATPTGINSNFTVGNATTPFTITTEDARTTFTGLLYYATPSITSTSASVTLRATIQDISALPSDPSYDANAGDIQRARVTFVDRDLGSAAIVGCSNLTPTLIVPGDLRTATVSCTVSLNTGGGDSKQWTIGTIVTNYYTRDNSVENEVVTVSKPLTSFITGGGYLVNTNSAGQYGGTAGAKSNFGFNVKYNKSGTSLQGNVNIITRRLVSGVWRTYQIKSNSISSLTASLAPGGTGGTAQFIGKANIKDITDPLNPISLSGNGQLQMTLKDNGEPGNTDTIGFTLYDNNVLLFSSAWTGTTTVEKVLGGGNLQVR